MGAALSHCVVSALSQVLPPTCFLSVDDITHYRQVFDAMDDDGGGTLSFDEVVDALKRLDTFTTMSAARSLFALADTDDSGEISFDEFVVLMAKCKVGAHGTRSVRDLSNASTQALTKLKQSTGLEISVEDALNAPLNPNAMTAAVSYISASTTDPFSCKEEGCQLTFTILVLDIDFLIKVMVVITNAMLNNLDGKLQELVQVSNFSSMIDKAAIVKDAVRFFTLGAHAYSHEHQLRMPVSRATLNELHCMRKAMCVAAVDKCMDVVVRAVAAKLAEQETMSRQDTLRRQGSFRSSRAGRAGGDTPSSFKSSESQLLVNVDAAKEAVEGASIRNGENEDDCTIM